MNPPKSARVISFTDVTVDNITEVSSYFLKKVSESNYVAVDLEFTGLSEVNPKDMNHRYIAYKKTVETHAMVSMGLSVVKQISEQRYVCDNFHFLTLKQGHLTIDTQTGHFLLKHQFSLDRLFQEGLAFWPPVHGPKYTSPLNELFKGLMKLLKRQSIPLVTHNGLYDLLYLYHSFIGSLPKSLTGFLSDFSNRFPSGIYDTKVLVKEEDDQASFLSYVFARLDRLRQKRYNSSTPDKPYFELNVQAPIPNQKKRRRSEEHDIKKTKKKPRGLDKQGIYCMQYAERGYCDNEHDTDSQYHNIETILDHQLGPPLCPVPESLPVIQLEEQVPQGGAHASHFDAYMTAFTFCYMLHTLSKETLADLRNKLNVGGQELPLVFPSLADARPSLSTQPVTSD